LLYKNPDWESAFSILVRDTQRGKLISNVYPKARLVYGGLDDLELLEKESAAADIILNFADSDNTHSAEAIVRGAKKHQVKPVFIIHTSGTGILTWKTVETGTFGQLEEKVYDDWEGIGEVTSLPDSAAHRNVDKIFLEAEENGNKLVKTAIVCPPSIYGIGRGPGNKRSQQLYNLSNIILSAGEGKRVGEGKNRQTHVHVKDLSQLYVLLIEAAAVGGGAATWGQQGYYFSSIGEQVNSLTLFQCKFC
jgi:nucleoside-diphosphate-sugar epimerase